MEDRFIVLGSDLLAPDAGKLKITSPTADVNQRADGGGGRGECHTLCKLGGEIVQRILSGGAYVRGEYVQGGIWILCRVLPRDELNGTTAEPLRVYCDGFITITCSCSCSLQPVPRTVAW